MRANSPDVKVYSPVPSDLGNLISGFFLHPSDPSSLDFFLPPSYFSIHCVPVVQRIERRFSKAKTTLLQEFADVISRAQTAAFKRLELLSRSSRVISNAPIFTHPGDTTGDTNFFFSTPMNRNNLQLAQCFFSGS